ncbi:unnamed protein product [Rotaria magnacalcarata]|uniref:Tetratricopeptide repeat protein n=1 Tax=Rotaria magnacalcarata TaxID=392030 RepID=A0A820GCU6_9BILA|nr:unnamed protein product [Rotaria magnacalcarata]CAF4275034.1 unnamed protein product [Rotaria magnacalcarata]
MTNFNDPSTVEKLQKALIIQEKCLLNHHPDLAVVYQSIALVHEKPGKFNSALLYNGYALRIRQKSLSANDPIIGFIYNNIRSIHFSTGNYPQAFLCFLKALLIYRKTLEDNHRKINKVKKDIQHARKPLTSKP